MLLIPILMDFIYVATTTYMWPSTENQHLVLIVEIPVLNFLIGAASFYLC